ncbi:site-specific integrase [Sphingomonas sp. RB1R13]|uniref:site-specific integrase n=1 Tax=Sphingomonas sp. RB1R13 TaxID=3096159 RepID=UPI002FCA0F43
MDANDVATLSKHLVQQTQPDPRLLVSLIRRWRSYDPERGSSPEWAALAPGTQKTWGSQLRIIEDRWGTTPLSLWNDYRMQSKVMDWRDTRSSTPRAADLGVMVLRELLKFGKLRGLVSQNAAAGIPTLYRGGNRAEIIWTEEDIDRFCWHAIMLERPHIIDGLMLAKMTGFRRADLVSMSDANVYQHTISKKALKASRGKRRMATMPRLPQLDLLLSELATRQREPGVRTLLVNSRGLPWTEDGFGGSFNRIRDDANIVHVDSETGVVRKKHLHDVRGTFATDLILAGTTDHEVAEIMGWAPERVSHIRRVYVDQARVVVAIGERIAATAVNRTVNRVLLD